jgi:hypothetical protein
MKDSAAHFLSQLNPDDRLIVKMLDTEKVRQHLHGHALACNADRSTCALALSMQKLLLPL